MAMRLLQRLSDHARERGNAPALIDAQSRETWSWRRLDAAARSVAERLLGGLPPGAVVLLCAENEPAFVAAFLGIMRAGLKACCVSPACPSAELQAIAAAVNAAAVIGTDACLAAAGDGRRAIPLPLVRQAGEEGQLLSTESLATMDQAGLLLQSSGTLGSPKIVRRSAASLDLVSEAMCETIGFNPSDRVLAVAPLCHSYGLEHGLLAPIWAGSCTILCRQFEVTALLGEECQTGTIFPGVPFMFEALGQAELRLPKLRLAYSAGGALPLASAEAFASRFGVGVGQVYGTTEIGSVTFGDGSGGHFAPQSVGRPMRGASIEIDPENGQVCVASDWMFDGYLGEAGRAGGEAFATGDLGRIDGEGNLFLTGRLKLVVDIGGRKVNPLEVESVLAGHPEVAQCVVIPMAMTGAVTRLKALVIPRGGAAPSPAELRRFVKDRLAAYKVPRVFELREQLPRSASGKILRHLIEG
jgi:acyl-CoA synthetase (AMP-forming)/AMP-acid ligase II